jgi:hypothetical protein
MGGLTNVHDEEQSLQPSVVSDDLVQSVDQKICERWHFPVLDFDVNFHKYHTLFCMRLSQLGKAITIFAQNGFQKCSQVHTKCLGFDFLRVISQRWQ